MDFMAFVGVALVILIVCVAMVFAYSQQTRRLQDIQNQLAKMEEKRADLLRQERAGWLDPLILLEGTLNQTAHPSLDDATLQQIEAARVAVKDINDKLMQSREWMGAPFDLEWAEYFERMPTLKKLYQAVVFEQPDTPELPKVIEQG